MFQSARIKLTIWYVLISMSVSIFFSAGLFLIVHQELVRNEERLELRLERMRMIDPTLGNNIELHHFDVDDTERGVILNLININLIIVAIASLAGYFLAGRTLAPIREMVDQQNQFIADASHELRTPLTALKTSVEVGLRDKSLNLQSAKHLLSENLEDINGLQTLSNNLLFLAAYRSNGRDTYQIVEYDEIVNRATAQLAKTAQSRHIKLQTHIEPLRVRGDRIKLQEMITIFVDNAIKYSPAKSDVLVNLTRVGSSAVLSIQDHGVGITSQDIPHIFERFYRSDASRGKSKIEGYGLGLAIAHAIIIAHHGAVNVQSVVGQGTIFTVRLPVVHS